MSILILVNYQDILLQFEFDENANVGDLKNSIQERTDLKPAEQQLVLPTDFDITDDIPLVALGIEDPILLLKKEIPKPTQQQRPNVGTQNNNYYGNGNRNGNGNGNGGYGGFYEPFLDGRTRINSVNPLPQFGIGSTITSNDFLSLLDQCETDSELFTILFEEKFKSVHPKFIGGPFSDFYMANKYSKKPIIINIHGQGTENTFFCSLLLSNPEVNQCIKDLGIQYWVGEMNKENELLYESLFGTPMKYPFLAVVGNIGNNFTVLEFINDLVTKQELIKKLRLATDHLASEIESRRLEGERRDAERRELEEQNKLFQQSQRQDKIKDIQKQEDAEMAQVTTASKITTVQDVRRTAIQCAKQLLPEPDSKSTPRPARIGIVLPDGSKKQRNFSPQQCIGDIFTWISGEIAARLTDETFLDDKSAPFDSIGEPIIPWTIDVYELVCSFPKLSFSIQDSATKIANSGLSSGGLLLLQRI